MDIYSKDDKYQKMLKMGIPQIAVDHQRNLDKKNTDTTINLLLDSCKENQTSLIMVSHDETLMKSFDNVYELNSGELI